MDQAALDWLATHSSEQDQGITALEELQRELDRPTDVAIASWKAAPPRFPLAVDPGNPEQALPTGHIDARAKVGRNIIIFIMFAGFGFLAWSRGVRMLFADFREGVIWALIVLPLLTLPW